MEQSILAGDSPAVHPSKLSLAARVLRAVIEVLLDLARTESLGIENRVVRCEGAEYTAFADRTEALAVGISFQECQNFCQCEVLELLV